MLKSEWILLVKFERLSYLILKINVSVILCFTQRCRKGFRTELYSKLLWCEVAQQLHLKISKLWLTKKSSYMLNFLACIWFNQQVIPLWKYLLIKSLEETLSAFLNADPIRCILRVLPEHCNEKLFWPKFLHVTEILAKKTSQKTIFKIPIFLGAHHRPQFILYLHKKFLKN